MKNLFFTAYYIGSLPITCIDLTCKDPLALNLGIEDNFQPSRVAFYKSNDHPHLI